MIIQIYGKTADSFCLKTDTGHSYYGYPQGQGITHDGDSIEMSIDNGTGIILGWVPFTQDSLPKG